VRNDVAMTKSATMTPVDQERASQPSFIPAGASCLQLELAHGPTIELTEVRIGRLFAFGLAENQTSWCLVRLSSVLALRFQTDSAQPSPQVIWTRKAPGELISSLILPATASITFREQPKRKVDLVLLGATRSLIATDSYQMPFIPIQAISYLEISQT
jgi:hypothetical protein